MRFIPSKVHAVLDYLTAVILILSPWLFGFATGGAVQWVPIVMGVVILVMSIFTDYELSLVKKVPLNNHLAMDIIGGIFLAGSPWLFGFADQVIWPHVIFGAFEIIAGLTTRNDQKASETTRSGSAALDNS